MSLLILTVSPEITILATFLVLGVCSFCTLSTRNCKSVKRLQRGGLRGKSHTPSRLQAEKPLRDQLGNALARTDTQCL